MDKKIQEAYVAGWQHALEDVMTTVEDRIRSMVENFEVPEKYAIKKSDKKLLVPEKKIITP
jgi:hypothetical protein